MMLSANVRGDSSLQNINDTYKLGLHYVLNEECLIKSSVLVDGLHTEPNFSTVNFSMRLLWKGASSEARMLWLP